MHSNPNLYKRFYIEAKKAEIEALQHLADNCAVVDAMKESIHQLQRERGMSNIYLGSKGARYSSELSEQIIKVDGSIKKLEGTLSELYLKKNTQHFNMPLFSKISIALQELSNLGAFRLDIHNLKVNMITATNGFSRLIAYLMAVIFEAADVASDPQITRQLVALFNLMQGKEFAGQERACGAIGFVDGQFGEELIQKIDNLQHAQQTCFSTFSEFASNDCDIDWREFERSESCQNVDRLRNMIMHLKSGERISDEISEVWYECATSRIDDIQVFEQALTEQLISTTKLKLSQALSNFKNQQIMLEKVESSNKSRLNLESVLLEPSSAELEDVSVMQNTALSSDDTTNLSSQGSFYELLKEQSQHIKKMSHELQEARLALHEQKQIDRAKLLLMQGSGLSESNAYKQLRSQAMNSGLKIAELARQVIENAK